MNSGKAHIGFVGAGGIARSHAYSLGALKYYYDKVPDFTLHAVSSASRSSRENFAARYGFSVIYSPDDFFNDPLTDTVFILGPNSIHFENLRDALKMKNIKRIYLEKPVCASSDQEEEIRELVKTFPAVKIQVGFQYLFSPAFRELLSVWRSGISGSPIHFDIKYYHSDYLAKEYRDKRRNRLTPAPDGGAMADLGSHALSMLVALLGNNLVITSAVQSGSYEDVPAGSDLFSLITLADKQTGATGTVAASRVSAGTGDELSVELYASEGALKYSSTRPEYFEMNNRKNGNWTRIMTGSSYSPVTSFPSQHVPPGWLRAMVHAHYVFLGGEAVENIIPDNYSAAFSEQLQTTTR